MPKKGKKKSQPVNNSTIDYEQLANDLIDFMCDEYGESFTIGKLVDFGLTEDMLIDELHFSETDIEGI